MQRKMLLEDQLEYARTEATLQQKLCKIEAGNEKARIDTDATKQGEIDKINIVNKKARINIEKAHIDMESQKQAVADELKLVQKLTDLNEQKYKHKQHISFAADQPARNDIDVEYRLTMFHAEGEPPPLPSLPAESVLDPNAKLYISNDDQSSIAESLTTSVTRECRPSKSIADKALSALDNVVKDQPLFKSIPDPLQTASNHCR